MKKCLTLAILLSVGCTTGPYIPKGLNIDDRSNYAIITTDSDTDHEILTGLNEIVTITQVDEKSFFSLGLMQENSQAAYLSPGFHVLRVQFRYLNTYANGCLELNSIGGESYIVRKQTDRYSVRFFIQNKKNGEIVGNICGFNADQGKVEK